MAKDAGGGQQRATRKTEREEQEIDDAPVESVKERHEKLADDVDSLLDEIDDVLEENAEEFVKSYIQKGGE